MALQLFANNAAGYLSSSITDTDVTIVLQAGQGTAFPSPSAGSYFYVTLYDGNTTLEIVKCTARSIDTLTVVRGQEGTAASAFASGSLVEVRTTAATLTNFIQRTGDTATDLVVTSADINGGTIDNTPIGATTRSTGLFTTLGVNGQFTSTIATGTAPFVIASTTLVSNLNSNYLQGGTWAIPGAIGSTTPSTGAFTTLSASGAVSLGANGSNTAAFGTAGANDSGATLRLYGALNAKNWAISSNFWTSGNLEFTPSTANGGATFSTPVWKLSSAGDMTVAGTSTLTGNVGIGGASTSARLLNISGSGTLAGANQTGVFALPAGTSAGAGSLAAAQTSWVTAASAYTVATAYGLVVNDGTLGAGSAVTTQYGIYIGDQTKGANNYGITSQVSAGTNKWNIYASGTAPSYFNHQLDVSGSSGGQIKFPATQNASSNANTLDDYEEGTFTPTIAGTTTAGAGTYTAQVGRYTKVGNRVHFQIYLNWTSHTGTGNMQVESLPFTSANVTNNYIAQSVWSANITLTAGNILQSYVTTNATRLVLQQVPTGGGAPISVPLDTVGELMLSGHYEV